MDQEQRIQLAIDFLKSHDTASVRQAATTFGVPRSTLQDRMAGRKPNKTSKQSMQRLSPEEEESIVRCILQMGAWGWPMTITALETLATTLLNDKGDKDPLGHNWYKNFLARHPEVKVQRSRNLDQSRKDASDYQTLREWFELYQTIRLQYNIAEEDTYNMDEKGCMKGIGDNSKVLISRAESKASTIQPGNRDWVSVIECIGINGFLLSPFIIFKGERIQESWLAKGKEVDKRTVIHVSPNAWTDQEIALEWLQHFDKYTTLQCRGEYRLLILDGHSSHVSFKFVQYCTDRKIIALCLPPHSTHILQPLDVGVFGPLAKEYRSLVSKGSIFGAVCIDNEQFLQYYFQARKTITRNIPGAWRGAGLYPYNPEYILQQYRPTTPPFASLTDKNGRRIDIQVGPDVAQKINEIVAQVIDVCPTPLRSGVSFVKDTCLTAIADRDTAIAERNTLQVLNQGLVEKQKAARKKKTTKYFGKARMLTLEEMETQAQEREEREAEEQRAKERRKALRGQITFSRNVWKEFNMSYDVFD